VGQVGVQEVLPQLGRRLLQVVRVERADRLHDVAAHIPERRILGLTKWLIHPRCFL